MLCRRARGGAPPEMRPPPLSPMPPASLGTLWHPAGSRAPRTPPLRRLKRGHAGRHSFRPPAGTAPPPPAAGALLRNQPHQNRFHYRLQAILLSSPCCTPRLSVERCCSRAPESAPRPGSGGAGAASGKPWSGPGSMQAPSTEVRALFCLARMCESGTHVAPAGHLRRPRLRRPVVGRGPHRERGGRHVCRRVLP